MGLVLSGLRGAQAAETEEERQRKQQEQEALLQKRMDALLGPVVKPDAPASGERNLSSLVTGDTPAEDEAGKGRKMREGWLPFLGAGATRIGGGYLSSMGMIPGAAISGAAETLAQKIESPDPVDPGAVALEAGLGAIPASAIIRQIKTGGTVAKNVLGNALRTAGVIEGGNMLRRSYYDREGFAPGNPFPQTLGELAMDVGTTGLGYKLAQRGSRNAGKQFLAQDEAQEDILAGLTGQTPHTGTTGRPDLDDIIRKHAGGVVSEPTLVKTRTGTARTPTGEVPMRESAVGPDLVAEKLAAEAKVPSNKPVLRVATLPQDPLEYAQATNARSIETGGKLPREVQLKLDAIDAKPSSIPREWLDSNGRPITPEAIAIAKHEDAVKEAQKAAVMKQFYQATEVKPAAAAAKAEQAAERETLKARAGGTDLGKIEQAAAKAQAGAQAEQVKTATASNIAEQRAKEMKDAEAKIARARAAIADAQKTMEAGPPSITAVTESVPTNVGKKTMRVTLRPKPPEEADLGEGVPVTTAPAGPAATAPIRKAPIAPADPEKVALTKFTSREAAERALMGSGRRGQIEGTNRNWRVVFEKEAGGEAPPAAPAGAVKPTEIPPTDPREQAVVGSPTGKERRSTGRVSTAEEDVRFLAERKRVAEGFKQTSKAAQDNVKMSQDAAASGRIPPPEAPPAPVTAKPKPGPKKPSGGATIGEAIAAKTAQKPVGAAKPPVKPAAPVAAAKPSVEAPEPPKQAPSKVGKMSKREIDAVTREDVAKWTPSEIKDARLKYPKDKRLMTILQDEVNARKAAQKAVESKPEVAPPTKSDLEAELQINRAEMERLHKSSESMTTAAGQADEYDRIQAKISDLAKRNRAIHEKLNAETPPVKPVEPATPKKGFEGPDRVAETKPANVKPQPNAPKPTGPGTGPTPTRVVISLEGAQTASEVRNRVVNELQKYKKLVADAEATKGVNEKGEYTYGTPLPKPITVEVPNGPSYTVKPDQVDGAIARLEKGLGTKGYDQHGTAAKIDPDEAFKGIVDKAERPTHVKVATGYGSNFNAQGGSAPSVKLPIGPEKPPTGGAPKPKAGLRVKAEAKAGPKIPKGREVKNLAEWSDKELAAAKNALAADDPIVIQAEAELVRRQVAAKGSPTTGSLEAPKAETPKASVTGQADPRPFMRHQTLARLWVEYQSKSGKASEAQISKVMERQDAATLERMLKERGVKIPENPAAPKAEVKAAAPKAEARPLEQAKPVAGTSKLVDIAQKEKDAWDNYFELKQGGKATPEEIRAAGKAAGEAKAASIAAVKEALQKGEPIPTFLQKHADDVAKKLESTGPKGVMPPKGKGPTSDELVNMPPEQQEEALRKAVEEFKGKLKPKSGKGTIIGGGFGSLQELYEKDPEMFSRLGLSAAGAIAGAATTPDDPAAGAIIGGAIGYNGPAMFRAMRRYAGGLPEGKAKDQVEKALGKQVAESAKTFVKLLPDYLRASYLARFPNLIFNSWAGPYGAATMGALEAAANGERRGLTALNALWNPKNWGGNIRDYWGDSMREARARVTESMERGDIADAASLGTGLKKKILTAPAVAMTAGDIAVRKLLMKSGFSEPEARALTLTSEPHIKNVGAFVKAKNAKGNREFLAKLMLPFYRTALNQIEQSALRTPFGNLLRNHWNMAPESTKKMLVQSGITTAVGIGAYQWGANSDPTTALIQVKFINNFFGPYGATASAMYLAGVASQKGVGASVAIPKGLMRYITTGLPLPTADILKEAIGFAEELGKGNFDPPYGVIPPPLSSKTGISVPTGVRYLSGDPEWRRPTKTEYGPVPFLFSDRPKLTPKPKTDYERQIQGIKEERARQRKAVRDSAER